MPQEESKTPIIKGPPKILTRKPVQPVQVESPSVVISSRIDPPLAPKETTVNPSLVVSRAPIIPRDNSISGGKQTREPYIRPEDRELLSSLVVEVIPSVLDSKKNIYNSEKIGKTKSVKVKKPNEAKIVVEKKPAVLTEQITSQLPIEDSQIKPLQKPPKKAQTKSKLQSQPQTQSQTQPQDPVIPVKKVFISSAKQRELQQSNS